MYYVTKLSKVFNPTIVETFENKELAFTYAETMNAANKGDYIVLEQSFQPNEPKLPANAD